MSSVVGPVGAFQTGGGCLLESFRGAAGDTSEASRFRHCATLCEGDNRAAGTVAGGPGRCCQWLRCAADSLLEGLAGGLEEVRARPAGRAVGSADLPPAPTV